MNRFLVLAIYFFIISCSGTKLTTHVGDIDQSQFDTIVFLGQHVTDDGSSSSEMYTNIRKNKGLMATVFNDSLPQEGVVMALDENKYFSNIEAVKEILRIDEEFGKRGFNAEIFEQQNVFIENNKNNARYGVFFVFKTKLQQRPNFFKRSDWYPEDLKFFIDELLDSNLIWANKNVLLRIFMFDLETREIVGFSKYSDRGFLHGDHFEDIFYSFISTFKYGNPIEPENLRSLRNWSQRVTITKKDGALLIGNINLRDDFKLEFTTQTETSLLSLEEIQTILDEDTGFQLFPKFEN